MTYRLLNLVLISWNNAKDLWSTIINHVHQTTYYKRFSKKKINSRIIYKKKIRHRIKHYYRVENSHSLHMFIIVIFSTSDSRIKSLKQFFSTLQKFGEVVISWSYRIKYLLIDHNRVCIIESYPKWKNLQTSFKINESYLKKSS